MYMLVRILESAHSILITVELMEHIIILIGSENVILHKYTIASITLQQLFTHYIIEYR